MSGFDSDLCVPWCAYLQGIPPGFMVGLGQYVILRNNFPGVTWLPWIIVTGLGYTIGMVTGPLLLAFNFPDPESRPSSDLFIYVLLVAPIGIAIGAAQAPLLVMKLKSRMFWLWPAATTIAFLAPYWIARVFIFYWSVGPSIIFGAVYGLITGLALILFLRGTTIPQVKEEAQDS